MMTRTFNGIMVLVILFFGSQNAHSQSSCKVLLEEISKSYSGKCKNGLAHGIGVAKGTDTYEGKFKRGLPHGKGKYLWANGNYYDGSWRNGKKNGKGILYIEDVDSTLRGIWREDKFYKQIEERPYEVNSKISLTGVSFFNYETTSFYKIEIIFQRDGRQYRSLNGVTLWGSSGFVKNTSNFTGFENVTFPFEGTIKFEAPNSYNTATVNYELEFTIKKASSWRVVLKY